MAEPKAPAGKATSAPVVEPNGQVPNGPLPQIKLEESGPEENYKVPLEVFHAGEKLESDLFFYHQRNYVLFKSKGQLWADEDVAKLASTEVKELFVRFRSPKDHHEFLHRKLKSIITHPGVPTERKAKVLYEISGPILTSVYSTPNSTDLMMSASNFVKSCVQYLNDRGSLPELFKLSGDSLTEHTHALHVSAYSVALAKKLGIREQTQIHALGLGAMLHDIGKSKIDAAILDKPGELNDEEWQLMRQHPEMGEQILYHRDIVPALSRRIVLEHHERVNGKGYPKGIKGIHQFSKIVAVCDTFNTLTSPRPYARAMTPFDALKFMVQHLRYEFDAQVLEAFIDMLSG
jgi:HD-GYP domain-containing protein (c-di-GMP phosphodiesterase class II)